MSSWEAHPHRRLNPLTGEWVLVSPHRTDRPWQGQIEKSAVPTQDPYDPECYLCPGNARAGGHRNPAYTGTFAFTNDYSALLPDTPSYSSHEHRLLTAEAERGICRVLCFSPQHNLTLSRMSVDEIRGVVDAWCTEHRELSALPFIQYVQIFENRGAMMGASNPHPHCQIWASEHIPNEVAKEHRAQRQYWQDRNSCLLCDYVAVEQTGQRLVYENAGFAVVVPFWAVWPFETLLIGKRHGGGIDDLAERERCELAEAFKQITTRYDNLFEAPFPYTMGIHQKPAGGKSDEGWHFHAHFYPPLLRSATVKKFMVGYEMLSMPQRDFTPESAAERLRGLPAIHYLDR